MFSVQLAQPSAPFGQSLCWKLNSKTSQCSSQPNLCSAEKWQRQAEADLGVSAEYFFLRKGARQRYIEIATRWYCVPGSDLYADRGFCQLVAARDRDNCSLEFLATFDDIDWSNSLIGGALSGNFDFFSGLLARRYLLTSEVGVSSLYTTLGPVFETRLRRASALGGNWQIFSFVNPELNSFTEYSAAIFGGSMEILLSLPLTNSPDTNLLFNSAFLSGNEQIVSHLMNLFPSVELSQFAEAAASSPNPNLLQLTGSSNQTLLIGAAFKGDEISFGRLVSSFSGQTSILTSALKACCQSVSPLRFGIALKCLNEGAKVDQAILKLAVWTGDIDLLHLIQSFSSLPLPYYLVKDAIETGNLQMVKQFHPIEDSTLQQHALSLGFSQISYLFARK